MRDKHLVLVSSKSASSSPTASKLSLPKIFMIEFLFIFVLWFFPFSHLFFCFSYLCFCCFHICTFVVFIFVCVTLPLVSSASPLASQLSPARDHPRIASFLVSSLLHSFTVVFQPLSFLLLLGWSQHSNLTEANHITRASHPSSCPLFYTASPLFFNL